MKVLFLSLPDTAPTRAIEIFYGLFLCSSLLQIFVLVYSVQWLNVVS